MDQFCGVLLSVSRQLSSPTKSGILRAEKAVRFEPFESAALPIAGAIQLAQQLPTETSSQFECDTTQPPTVVADDKKLKAFTSR